MRKKNRVKYSSHWSWWFFLDPVPQSINDKKQMIINVARVERWSIEWKRVSLNYIKRLIFKIYKESKHVTSKKQQSRLSTWLKRKRCLSSVWWSRFHPQDLHWNRETSSHKTFSGLHTGGVESMNPTPLPSHANKPSFKSQSPTNKLNCKIS